MRSILRDYMEKFKDRSWRLEHLYKVVDEDGRKVQFKLRPVQRYLLDELHYYNIVLKARQMGFTTFIDLLALDMALFTSNFSVVIIAHKKEDAKKIFRGKIKDVYNDLPAELRAAVRTCKSDEGELILSNGSSIKVTTSARSTTCQFLHISEYGKICAKYPEKALEIKTGSLPAVHPGGFVFIESTAEGNAGHFFDMCQAARKTRQLDRQLMMQEFKFHFFPWYQHPDYVISEEVVIPERLTKYFDELAIVHDIELTQEQMNWYAATEKMFGDDMRREYPSFPDEAFRVSQEGTFYKREFERIYKEKRICAVNYETFLPVFTFWDLGVSDDTAIWFAQFAGKEIRLIDYYVQNGEGLAHYAKVLSERGYRYGGHYAPHDVAVRELGTGKARVDFALELGIKFDAVATGVDLMGGIEQVRTLLSQCYFDEKKCDDGIKCLENYRKEWDEKHGIFKGKPLHDWTSHGADAFRTLAVAVGNDQLPLNVKQPRQYPTKSSLEGWKL